MLEYYKTNNDQRCWNILKEPANLDVVFPLWLLQAYHELDQSENAVSTMEEAFLRHPESISAEDVNLLLELCMNMKEYRKPLAVLVQHCGLELVLPNDQVIKAKPSGQITIPENMPNPIK